VPSVRFLAAGTGNGHIANGTECQTAKFADVSRLFTALIKHMALAFGIPLTGVINKGTHIGKTHAAPFTIDFHTNLQNKN
jgi:hypothetical protein